MKLKISLVFLFLSRFAFSQTGTINEATFSKAVDYVNCKAVELSLIKSPTIGVTAEFKSKCNCQEYPNAIAIKEAIPSSQTGTIELETEFQTLKKNEYKSNLDTENVINLLTKEIFSNQKKYPKLFAFAERKTDKDFQTFITQLKRDLNNLLNSYANNSIDTTKAKPKENTSDTLKTQYLYLSEKIKDIIEDKINKKIWYGGLILFISVVIIFLIFGFINHKLNDKRHKTSVSKNWVISEITETKNTIVSSLKEKFGNDIEKVKSDIKQGKLKKENSFEETKTKIEEKPFDDNKTLSEIFYFPAPNKDGSFNDSDKLPTFKESESIYKFSIKDNKAIFSFVENSISLKRALNLPDTYIKPVCESENSFFPNAKNIKVTKEGTAIEEGHIWKVTNKAKIRYE